MSPSFEPSTVRSVDPVLVIPGGLPSPVFPEESCNFVADCSLLLGPWPLVESGAAGGSEALTVGLSNGLADGVARGVGSVLRRGWPCRPGYAEVSV